MLSFAIVPGLPTATTIEVWVAVLSLNERPRAPANARIQNDVTGVSVPIAAWTEWLVPDQSAGIVYARVTLENLPVRAHQRVQFITDGVSRASAAIGTLPDRLPGVDERPFTLMLGSCFCRAEDKSGRVGRTFAMLPDSLRPDLKMLCGDQVYLDSPFFKFLLPHSTQGLAEIFLQNYVETWTQSGDLQGFQQVLSSGPALFSSDDHEFWNNAPFPSFSVNTWTEGGRRAWWQLASGLLSTFQMPDAAGAVRIVNVGELQMCVADTRVRRSSDRTTVLVPADMQRLVSWIRGLTFPGVLVLGQPIFAKKAGIQGNIADWNLPDFDQYADLVRAILDAPQPIVVLTGDVHYGRVSRLVTNRGVDILEIIASPMSLVTGGGERTWKDTPGQFPADAVPGVASRPITTVATWTRAADHFITIEMWRQGGRLRLRVRTHETKPDATSPSAAVFDDAVQQRIM